MPAPSATRTSTSTGNGKSPISTPLPSQGLSKAAWALSARGSALTIPWVRRSASSAADSFCGASGVPSTGRGNCTVSVPARPASHRSMAPAQGAGRPRWRAPPDRPSSHSTTAGNGPNHRVSSGTSENTARHLIAFLNERRLGRAVFQPGQGAAFQIAGPGGRTARSGPDCGSRSAPSCPGGSIPRTDTSAASPWHRLHCRSARRRSAMPDDRSRRARWPGACC